MERGKLQEAFVKADRPERIAMVRTLARQEDVLLRALLHRLGKGATLSLDDFEAALRSEVSMDVEVEEGHVHVLRIALTSRCCRECGQHIPGSGP